MLKNHFKIAFRQIKKQKFFSAVNILGLAIGVTCCLMITLFIRDELSYDSHHPNVENTYRLVRDMRMSDGAARVTVCPPILAKSLEEEIPEITKAARINPYFFNAGSNLVRKASVKENQFEDHFAYVDQGILEMFHLPLIHGSKSDALVKPYTIIISERIAEKYFGTQSPIGETFVFNDKPDDQTYTITGVMENIPQQNHFHYDFLMSMKTLNDSYENQTYLSNNYYTYVTLAKGTDPKKLEDKFHDFIMTQMAPEFKDKINLDLANMDEGHFYKFDLMPITDIHLNSAADFPQLQRMGDIRYVWLFGAIALFILLIALVNFVNLSTSRSANRAKEVGLRKVLGSVKNQLISQFLMESILMSCIAFSIGTIFASLLLSPFNTFIEKDLSIPFSNPVFMFTLVGSAILAGFLAGLYPAFYLSKFQPVKVLKGKLSLGAKNSWLRSSLVVGQFAISIGLIVGTLVVKGQMDFIQNKKLGFEKDQLLIIRDTYTLRDKIQTFKEELKKLPEAKNVSMSGFLPIDGANRNSNTFNPKERPDPSDQVQLQSWRVDEDYISTLGMKLIEGRNIKDDLAADSASVVLNQTSVKAFNLGENPIGKIILPPVSKREFTVVGVVEDFHYESFKGKVQSVGLFQGTSNNAICIRSTADEMDDLIAKTESTWNKFAPTQPLRYEFMDEQFATMHITEQRVGTLFGIFSMLAIFIACLGLLALATFMTEQRMKEIGIRKVLGATVYNIVFALSKQFIIYVLIGLVIAVPIAWMQMNNWLNSFAYRINMEWWMFALAGVLATAIALITVGSQTLRAAMNNPVDAIKTE